MAALTIACAVDLSECSRRALRYAGALVEHFGAHLHVIHVSELPIESGPPGSPDLSGPDGQARLLDFVSREVPLVTRWGGCLEVEMRPGHPAREILKFVTARRADLLVMGSHGRRDLQAPFFGSTTAHALRRSPIPVLAVPVGGPAGSPLIRMGPVLAPVDFSPASVIDSRIARGIAAALSVPLLLVHVVRQPGQTAASQNMTREIDPQDPAACMAALVTSLEDGVTVESVIRNGSPAAGIAKVALERGVSLIVMSLKGRSGPLRRRQAGALAYEVMCVAPVPVLALPPVVVDAFAMLGSNDDRTTEPGVSPQ